MSTPDDINISDDEFDAFLKGEGELALMLRKLPQGQPSAQLDDAILAAAKADMAASPGAPVAAVVQPVQQAAQQAANDPVMPGKEKSTRSFTNRWRIPLGLAASLFVTVQLVRMEVQDERMQPGTLPLLLEKQAAPVPPPAMVDMASPAVSVKIVPPPGYEPPPGISAKPVAPAPTTTAAIEAAQATAAAALPSEQKRKLRRAAPQEEQRVAAPAPMPSLMPPVVVTPAPVMQYAPAPATPAPAPDYAAKLTAREQPAPTVYGSLDAAPASSAHAATPVAAAAPRPVELPLPAAAPMAAPAPVSASARAAAAPTVVDKAEPTVQRVEVTGSTARHTNPEMAEAGEDIKKSANASSDADVQLAKIDALLKSGSTPEALAAWRKFRRAYPDYKVPDGLRTKIDALLNQQTLDSGR